MIGGTVPAAAAARFRALARADPHCAGATRPQRRGISHAAGSTAARLQPLLLLRAAEPARRTGTNDNSATS